MNIRTTCFMLFFSLFFAPVFCAYQEFTYDHFEMIKNSENSGFTASSLLSKNQKFFLFNLFDDGNLIRLINHYHTIPGSNILDAQQILQSLFRIGLCSDNYTAMNNSFFKTREHLLNVLKSYIANPITTDLERLTEKTYVDSIIQTLLVDESGNTGLMLAAQTENPKVFKYFFSAYMNQNCPLDTKNTNGETVFDIVQRVGTHKMQSNKKYKREYKKYRNLNSIN